MTKVSVACADRRNTGFSRQHLASAISAALAIAVAAPAGALEFSAGGLDGNIDTTLSWGARWRVEERDQAIIGIANGGTGFSVNADDGNLNYDKGLVSNTVKLTSELELSGENAGLFIRGTAFYDDENESGEREHVALTDEALDLVGSDAELLDAYVWYRGGDRYPFELRAGNQLLSWGESTFIQNGINTINPVDASKFRVPGAELREALVPVPMISGSVAVGDNGSLEAFYQIGWEKTEIDPPGSYFSTNDFVGAGGDRVQLGFGAQAESDFLSVGRGEEVEPDEDGQFGVAYRLYSPSLNDTEFGFYYLNYHSRLPVISATTGSDAGLLSAGAIAGAAPAVIGSALTALGGGSTPDDAIAAGIAAGTAAGLDAGTAGGIAGAAVNTAALGGDGATAGGAAATGFATTAYADTAVYRVEYPEDIQLLGLSFNTLLEGPGVALQGEISHRRDQPLQVDDIELLFAALGPINAGLAGNNQVGDFSGQTSTDIPGFILRDVTQLQMTATKLFGPMLGAEAAVLVAEAGVTHVHDMPDKSELRLDGPATFVSGNQALAAAHGAHVAGFYEDGSHFADATSWGYRLVGRLSYNNAWRSWNLLPRIAYSQDVSGNTPLPLGNFLEGRYATTLGLQATRQNRWALDLSYTRYGGAGRYNLLRDRDFVAFNVKYSF